MELSIPARALDAPTGTQFIASIMPIPFDGGWDAARETAYLNQYLAGNVPTFMRKLQRVTIGDYTVFVTPDYLCIGSDDDYVRTPMNPITAQKIADAWNAVLPTPDIVDATFEQAHQLVFRAMTPPQYPYNQSMMHTSRYVMHSRWIDDELQQTGVLVAGHKKDVVLDPWLETVKWLKVGVYGAFDARKRPIHTFLRHSHEVTYKDYSHGVRLLHRTVWAAGQPMEYNAVLTDDSRSSALSKRGCFKEPRYPVV